MAILHNELKQFKNKLENDELFKEIKIIESYPYVIKPTRLKKVVLCLSISEVSAQSCSVGEEYMYGQYKINVDIYVPYELNAQTIYTIFDNIVNLFDDYSLVGISTNNITSDKTTLCYTARCSLTFNDVFNIGGVENANG